MRRRLRFAALALLVVLALLSPAIAWRLAPNRTLDVVIVDKTVPFANYRGHAAIPWILHAMKVRGSNGRFLEPSVDYVGYDPKTKTGHDLTDAALERAGALVVTDTYGVYRGDYESGLDRAALERSPRIYGGLTDDEASVLGRFLERDGLVIAEFNTFGSPTEDAARRHLERLFGVRWTKWVGRYWANLQDANEVPKWVGALWQRKTRTPFDLTGGGFVLVREDEDIVVLRDGEDLSPDVVMQERTAKGAEFGFPSRGLFRHWMDVVVPEGAEVLYEHVLQATPAGLAKLEAHGLSRRFPAIVRQKNAWYFAGNFVDAEIDLGYPEIAGTFTWRGTTGGCGPSGSPEEAFFWRFYAPIVERLFASRAK